MYFEVQCPECARLTRVVIVVLQMVQACGERFEPYRQVIKNRAVGGGIVCSLDDDSLRGFLKEISMTHRSDQDVIIHALGELRRNTERALAALEESGSPYTFNVVKALKTHNAAYITFTKV